jgi:hemerythrin-like domain-containing protein
MEVNSFYVERSFFPMLQRRYNIDPKVIQSLVGDHNEMIDLENKILQAFKDKDSGTKELVTDFIDLLLSHLCEEEMTLVPYMLQSSSLYDDDDY